MAHNHPLVSVILPVYNGEPYLQESIQSILKQDYPNFEFIIINDGSSDASWDIIQQIQDYRVRVFTQENCGLPATLNRGIHLAKGEFIARIDQDDRALPKRLSAQILFLQTHPQIGVVGSAYRIIDATGTVIGIRYPLCMPHQVKRHLFIGNPFCHGSVVFHKHIVLSVGGYDHEAPIEDYELWSRLAGVTQITNLPDVLYDYRIGLDTSMVIVNKEKFVKETEKIRCRVWEHAIPPSVWGGCSASSLWYERRQLKKYPLIPKGTHNRSQHELHMTVGLSIAYHYTKVGAWRHVLGEVAGLFLMHTPHFRQLARLLSHLPKIFAGLLRARGTDQ
jgi:glycosyltransferase involved in cell wall biosynthesis